MIRRHLVFYGWVQGVGFRYRAQHAARMYSCTGWVKNEWDGSVTMEIQGTEENIDQVILAIGQKPGSTPIEGAETDDKGRLQVVNGATSLPGVFAGGDIVNGGKTVVDAVAGGKMAAFSILQYLGR